MAVVVVDSTLNKPATTYFGDRKVTFKDVTLGVYATGGLALTSAQLGFKLGVDNIDIEPVTVGGTVYRFEYDRPTAKLKAYIGTTGAEVGNAVDLSAVVAKVMSVGK